MHRGHSSLSPAPRAPGTGGDGPCPPDLYATPDDRAAATAALARCVGDPDAFLARRPDAGPHLQRRARRGRRQEGDSPSDGFDDLLSLADVDGVVAGGGLRHPAVRLVRDGEVLPLHRFTRPSRTGRTRTDDLIDPAKTLDLLADGATVVLQALQRWWPPLARFCRHLELALGHPMQANAYLTPPGAAGLAPHHDTHDVFVLQVAGSKHWCLRRPVIEAPLARHASDHEVAARQPVLLEADLEPGDSLYMPRGVVHSAAAQEGLSLHLTLGVLATTAHDVVRRVLDGAADEVALRRNLPAGYPFDPDGTRRAVTDIVDQLVAWLATTDTEDIADQLRTEFLTGRRPLLDGHLLELAGLGAIDDATVVRRRPGTVCTLASVEPDPGAVDAGATPGDAEPAAGPRPEAVLRLTLGDRHLDLPPGLDAAVRRLLDGTPRRVGELADLMDGPSRLVLARRLVREGALVTDARERRWPSR